MNRKIIKISLLIVIVLMLLTIKTYAVSCYLKTDNTNIKAGEDIVLKMQTDKNIKTASFIINYDKSKVDFIETQTEHVQFKNNHEEGNVSVVYIDINQVGTKEIVFKFKAKEDVKGTTNFNISKLAIQYVGEENGYKGKDIDQKGLTINVNIATSPLILQLGYIVAFAVVFILIVLLIIHNINYKKQKQNKQNNA